MKFNKLLPELTVSSLEKSLDFYVGVLGFKVEYERPESRFAFLSLQGSQLMLEEKRGAAPEGPFGRGIDFQITVDSITPLLAALKESNYPLEAGAKDYWYRVKDRLVGFKGFMVLDPDGYRLLFNEDLGSRPLE